MQALCARTQPTQWANWQASGQRLLPCSGPRIRYLAAAPVLITYQVRHVVVVVPHGRAPHDQLAQCTAIAQLLQDVQPPVLRFLNDRRERKWGFGVAAKPGQGLGNRQITCTLKKHSWAPTHPRANSDARRHAPVVRAQPTTGPEGRLNYTSMQVK